MRPGYSISWTAARMADGAMKMEVVVKEKTKRSWRLNMTRVRAIAERLPNARPNVYKYISEIRS